MALPVAAAAKVAAQRALRKVAVRRLQQRSQGKKKRRGAGPLAVALIVLVVGVVLTTSPTMLLFSILGAGGGATGAAAEEAERLQSCMGAPQGSGYGPTASSTGDLRLAQFNLPQRSTDFTGALKKATALGPDFITLNEVAGRDDTALSPAGYDNQHGPGTGPQVNSTAVLWRTDRWSRVSGGREQILNDGPQKWDAGRSATWVTLQDKTGLLVSVVSVHMMINPRIYGPNKPLRQTLYERSMGEVRDLADDLSKTGPVLVAGDMNSAYTDNDPWGPRRVLGQVGMKSTRDVLGDNDSPLDYIFFKPSQATPIKQDTVRFPEKVSDHPMVWADFNLTASTRPNQDDAADGSDGAAPVPANDDATTEGPDGETGGPMTVAGQELSAAQVANAKRIVAVGKQARVGEYGLLVALTVASQESGNYKMYANRNVPESLGYPHDAVGQDHDSLGLFQQRPSMGWGSVAQLMDATYNSRKFYERLKQVSGWQQMSVAAAGQAVQRSANGAWYADNEQFARDLLAALGDVPAGSIGTPIGCTPSAMASCPATPWPDLETGLTPDARLVLRCTHEKFPQVSTFYGVADRPSNPESDHPAGRAVDVMIDEYDTPKGKAIGDKVAAWLQTQQAALGIKYVIWKDKIWHAGDGTKWSPYDEMEGCGDTSDNCRHMNHVHVSVYGNAATQPSATGEWVVPLQTPYFVGSGMPPHGYDGHTGQDLALDRGNPIVAAAAGTVERTKVICTIEGASRCSYGRYVVIDHGGGVTTWYAHMNGFASGLSPGRKVKAGQVIGYVGSTGNSTGPHLHFEVRRDMQPIDPMTFMQHHGAALQCGVNMKGYSSWRGDRPACPGVTPPT